MKNKYGIKINNKISQLFFTDNPVEFTEYFNVIQNITTINIDNIENIKQKYELYLTLFIEWKLKPRPKRLPTYTSHLGFYCKTNLNIQYWLDRGFNETHFNEYMKIRQNTCSLDAIEKNNKCTKTEALIILTDRTRKQVNTLNSRVDILDINYKKGNASRKSYWLNNKINPDTGLLYTETELKILFNKRYGWRLNTKYTLKDRLTNNCCIEYWLAKTNSLEEAEEKLKERQKTFSLQKCIDKYGEKTGLIKWEERQKKWLNTLNSKSTEEKLTILIKKMARPNFWSITSIAFFDELIIDIQNKFNTNYFYNYKNNEYFINTNGKFYLYDFTIKELNIIIEYNGSHVHPNKQKLTTEQWKKWKNPFTKEDAELCYKKDLYKINCAKAKGFDVLVIWDTDIKQNKQKVKNKILKLINKNRNK